MSRQCARRVRLRPSRAPTLAAAALCGLAIGGCATRPMQGVEPAAVAAAWHAIDAAAASAAVGAALPPATAARGFDLADGISLAEAEATALFFNPSLRATRLQIGIAESEAHYARLWQDPELDVDGAYILDDVDEPWVLGAGLAVTIPLSGRPALAKELAESKIDAGAAAALGAEWALLTLLRREWLSLAHWDARIDLLQRSVAELQQLIELAPRLRAAGTLKLVDERLLRIQRQRALGELRQAEAARGEQRLVVIAALGLHPDRPWRFETALERPADPGAAPDLAALLQHPSLREVMAAYQVAERRLQLEVRRQYPDLRIGLGGGSEDGESRVLFALGLIPIPVWNANRLGIATAETERAAAALAIEQALQDLVHRATLATRQHAAAGARVAFLEQDLAPLVDRQVRDVRRLAGLGQFDLFLLADAMQQAREIRLELLDARVATIHAALELAALAGPSQTPAAAATTPEPSQ
ncbi:MAG: TolC family protein [Gammaproteobacteria bacterium]|nr:TolC family protein [Gammaproteobacteria bacterium]